MGVIRKLHSVAGCALVQLEHCLGFSHCSHMCPYSWHLLQKIGSWMSFVMTTHEFAMKTCSVRSWLAALGVAHSTLMLAVFCPGDHLSGFLIHDVATITPLSSLCLASMENSWVLSLGEKEPSHSMNSLPLGMCIVGSLLCFRSA